MRLQEVGAVLHLDSVSGFGPSGGQSGKNAHVNRCLSRGIEGQNEGFIAAELAQFDTSKQDNFVLESAAAMRPASPGQVSSHYGLGPVQVGEVQHMQVLEHCSCA